MTTEGQLWQVAWSVRDEARMISFYRDVFLLRDGGGTKLFRGAVASRVQGLRRVASTCHWLYPPGQHFQLELFAFEPPNTPREREGRLPTDIGYSRVAFAVKSFDAALERLRAHGSPAVSEVVTEAGRRHACFLDPEGNVVEVIESPELEQPVRVAGVAANVPSLELAIATFGAALGLARSAQDGVPVASLLGLKGAVANTVRFGGGDACWIELNELVAPESRPWPADYRISDLGFLNVALGFRQRSAFLHTYRHATAAGMRRNWFPLSLGVADVVYLNDQQGFSVELLRLHPRLDRAMGFGPPYAWLT